MKIWRITLMGKFNGRKSCIYHKAATKEEVKNYFDDSFNHNNFLLNIKDITNTKTGKKLAESL